MRKRISSVSAPVAAKREPDTRDLDGPQGRTDRGRDGFIEVEARHIAGLGVTVSDSGDAGICRGYEADHTEAASVAPTIRTVKR